MYFETLVIPWSLLLIPLHNLETGLLKLNLISNFTSRSFFKLFFFFKSVSVYAGIKTNTKRQLSEFAFMTLFSKIISNNFLSFAITTSELMLNTVIVGVKSQVYIFIERKHIS